MQHRHAGDRSDRMLFSTSLFSARPIIAVAHNRQRARAGAPVDLQTKAYVLA